MNDLWRRWTRSDACTFHDPFLTHMKQVGSVIYESTRDHGTLKNQFAVGVIGWDITKDAESKGINSPESLRHVYNNFSSHEEKWDEALELCRGVLKRTRSPHRTSSVGRFIGELEDLMMLTREMKIGMTLTHLELQEHFYALVVRITRSPDASNSEVADFFEPLYRLRDAYFYEPSNATLEAYLATTRELVSSPYYLETVVGGVEQGRLKQEQAVVQEHEDALEVAALLQH